MSHIQTQRAIVRMLFDPDFQRRVYAAPDPALADCDLTTDERKWLVQPDPRAYGTDPLFRSRSLYGLLGELPVSGALAVRALGSSAPLERFYSSRFLHRAIQEGSSLALALLTWLIQSVREGRIHDPRVAETAKLEHAMACLRRPSPPPPSAPITLSSTARIAAVGTGSLALYESVLSRIQAVDADPATVAIDTRFPLGISALPPGGATYERILATITTGQVALELLPEGLAAMLALAAKGCTGPELAQCAQRHGAPAEDVEEILLSLVQDGLLICA